MTPASASRAVPAARNAAEEDRVMVFPKRLDVRVAIVADEGDAPTATCCRSATPVPRRAPRERVGHGGPGSAHRVRWPGAALVLVEPRYADAAMGIGLAAAVGLLLGEIWGEERFDQFTSQPGPLILAFILGGTALGATAATFQRVPAAFAIAAFAVLPASASDPDRRRDELPPGSALRRDRRRVPSRPRGCARRGKRTSSRPRALLASVSRPRSAGSPSPSLCRMVVWHRVVGQPDVLPGPVRRCSRCFATSAGIRKLAGQVLMASVLVAVGFALLALWQYLSRDLLLNKDLKDANQLHPSTRSS